MLYIFSIILFCTSLFGNEKIFLSASEFVIPKGDTIYTNYPSRKVKLTSFYIDKYEVSYNDIAKKFPQLIPTYFSNDDMSLPVFNISYKQALEYCHSKGGDLPTEVEWIRAAAFDGKFHKLPSKFSINSDLVNVRFSLKGINDIYGMLGNVWEMVKTKGDFVLVKGGSFFEYNKLPLVDVRVKNLVLKQDVSSRLTIGFRCVYRNIK